MLPLLRAPLQDGFMPHGMCYLWEPGLMGLHITSDALIALAYFAIPPALIYFVVRARQALPRGEIAGSRSLPFEWMWLAFGLFIVACGATHAMGIWTLWEPDYWLSGGVKAVTAIASLATAIALPPLIPRALDLLRAARESEARRVRLEEAHSELETLYDKLKEFDELKSEFFANVSHELRTPLSLILAPTDRLLRSDALDREARAELQIVSRNARLLHKHVDDLLDVAKLDAGRMEPSYAPVDLAELVRRTTSAFEAVAAEEQIDFLVETPARLGAQADPDHVERILLNLLSNAFKFTPSGGSVRCRLEVESAGGGPADAAEAGEAGSVAVLSVGDSGPGVESELRETVFERFRQAERGTGRRYGGTGLGLSIVRDLAELHGGTARIGDAAEGGALVTVEIPLRRESLPEEASGRTSDAEESPEDESATLEPDTVGLTLASLESERAARKATGARRVTVPDRDPSVAAVEGSGEPGADGPGSAADAPPPAPALRRPRVLVVEDNRDMARFLGRALSDRYEVRTAGDGSEGLRVAESWIPDLVLTDIMMPGLPGDRMIEAMRERPELDPVPIVVLSAKADEELRIRLLGGGAQDYVTKPFAEEEVRARVDNLMQLKRTRDILQEEVRAHAESLEGLASALAGRTRQLSRALDEARSARREAEAASAVKSEFLAVVSHELRTPLNAVVMFAGLLEDEVAGSLSEEQRDQVVRLQSNARALLDLIDQMLVFARGDEGFETEIPQRVVLGELVAELDAFARPGATRKGLRFLVEGPPADATVVLDPRRVRQVLTHLLDNALKFTEAGEVGLEVEMDEGSVRFRVRDTGIGIAPEDVERIFDPFWQVDRGITRKVKGVGLGLDIARRMARAMDAEIEVESVPGQGSVFVLSVPTRTPALH